MQQLSQATFEVGIMGQPVSGESNHGLPARCGVFFCSVREKVNMGIAGSDSSLEFSLVRFGRWGGLVFDSDHSCLPMFPNGDLGLLQWPLLTNCWRQRLGTAVANCGSVPTQNVHDDI
jgi:hypothetical protein